MSMFKGKHIRNKRKVCMHVFIHLILNVPDHAYVLRVNKLETRERLYACRGVWNPGGYSRKRMENSIENRQD